MQESCAGLPGKTVDGFETSMSVNYIGTVFSPSR